MPQVLPVLYSFFTPAGALDLDAVAAQVGWAVENGADGITLLGLASEGWLLEVEEREATINAVTACLPAHLDLYVTLRPEDDAVRICDLAASRGHRPHLIFQAGRNAEETLKQLLGFSQSADQVAPAIVGMQIAPGLLDTDFSLQTLGRHPDLLRRISFVKAEYESLELARDWASLQFDGRLIVGRHGLNYADYLRIGAKGVIPGTEMTPGLVRMSRIWAEGRTDDALAECGAFAPYIEFAMQDLATVVSVGKAVTGRLLGFDGFRMRMETGFDPEGLAEAVAFWLGVWTKYVASGAEYEGTRK